MYRLLIEVHVKAEQDEQCQTVARKLHAAIEQVTKRAPYGVSWRIQAQRMEQTEPQAATV